MRIPSTLIYSALAGVLLAGPSVAAEPKVIGKYKDWSAYLLKNKRATVCYLAGEPKNSAGKYKSRGRTFLQVGHRPKEKVKDEVSVTAGYTYRKKSSVVAVVDGKKFKLFTQNDGAWMHNSKSDLAIIKALKAGKKLVVQGQSSRGTKTSDTYSLAGFSAAYTAIGKACRVK